MDNDDSKIQQGQELYSGSQQPATTTPEALSPPTFETENLEQYAPPEMPPLTPTENILASVKRFAIPGILVLVAIGLIVGFFLVLRGTGINKEVTLTYWTLWEDEKVYQPIISDYQKTKPQIKINVVKQTPIEYRERLENAILKNQGPDIFRFHNTWLPMFLSKTPKPVIAPVPAEIARKIQFETTFYPVVRNDLFASNFYYGIPLTFDGLGLYYNEKLFSSAGVSVPKTWQELRTAAAALTVKNSSGQITTSGAAIGTTNNIDFWSDILGLLFYQSGVNIYGANTPAGEEALLFYSLFAQKPDNVWDKDLDNSTLAFASGKVAMIFAPSWLAFEIAAMNPDLSFKVAPVPQIPNTPTVSWASYWVEGVSATSTHQKEAFDFLAYMVERENLTKLYNEEAKMRPSLAFGEPYSRVDLAESLLKNQIVGAIVSQGPTARSGYLSSRTLDAGLNDQIIQYYQNAVNSVLEGASPGQALTTATQGVNQVLSQFGLSGGSPTAPSK